LEASVLGIWAEVLGRTDFGVDDDYFDLGGHSLLATQIASRIRVRLGVAVPVHILFAHPTVAGLAGWIETARTRSGLEPPSIVASDRGAPLRLSASQERMWFLNELRPNSAAYNIIDAVRLRGELDVAALAAAIDDLVNRHEGLRTRFPVENGRAVQEILPHAHVDLEVLDRRSAPSVEGLGRILPELRLACQRPFRLDELPLMRWQLYVLADHDHVLFVNMHHIIGDQWTFGVLRRELAACYNARRAGREPALAPLEVQFGDYVQWHRGWLESGAIDAQLEYWRQQLAGYPTIDISSDRHRPPIQTSHGAILTIAVPERIRDGITQLCVRHRVSPFMVFLGALDVLVHRYTGATDVVVGAPIANRDWLESEALVGTFVNTVVMRTDLSGDPTFGELLGRVQRVALDAYANQDAPFATVVSELHPVRDLSRSPLFQIFLNVMNAPTALPEFAGITVEPITIDRGAAQFDLSLSVDLTITNELDLEYNTDLFDRPTIERLGAHLLAILDTATRDASQQLGAIELLSEAERAEVEATWSGPAVDVEPCVGAHVLVERQVARAPDRIALRADHQVVTYGELDNRANQLAHHLIESGVGGGDLVGVHLERSVEMVVAVLAILKAGAGYVPLDPALPPGRLNFMVEDTAVTLVISRADTVKLGAADGLGPPVLVLLDRDAAAIAGCSSTRPLAGCHGRDRAHVIYTSGSTGRPKGIEVEHRSVVSFLQAMTYVPGISADDVVLAGTTLSFDPSVLEIFLPLIHGAQIVIADRDTMADPVALSSLLRRTGVTMMQATPTTWRLLVDSGWKGEPGLTAFYGGEPMTADLLTAMLDRCRTLWNLYGPTETTVWATAHRVDRGDLARPAVPVGRPVANTRCYVLGPYGQPQPVGVPGELCIGGTGVARGYLHRPELTAERFVPDPFSLDPGARLYRTGDLARLLPHGELELLGRLDHQVKIRGHRIELGEIEQTLSGHPALRAAAITTWTPVPGDVRLAAYYIRHKEQAVEAEELRAHLRSTLPSYMVPAAYVELDAFPLTSSNKIARNKLPPPEVQPPGGSRRTPQTRAERTLVEIWQEVLGQREIGIDDDFFDLGGHSLLAIRAFAAMEKLTGRRLPLSTLFQAPTIEELARRYDDAGLADDPTQACWTSLVPMQTEGERPPIFYVSPFLITILSFSHLARCMRPDQPFFLLQPQGMEGQHAVHDRVEEMAAHYISEMRQVQSVGPYRIGGHCAGSWVAFEMARQLQQAGEEVALVLAVDWAPPGITPPATTMGHALGRLRSYWRDRALVKSLRWQLRVRTEGYVTRRFGTGEKRRLAALRHAHAEAHRNYEPGLFDGDLVLLRTEDWARRPDKNWHLQWQDLITGELIVDSIVGRHGDLTANTHASELAFKIRAAVDRSKMPRKTVHDVSE
jgi:amino acid adenylation domain-containing protein